MENEENLLNDNIEPTEEPTEVPTPEPFVIPSIYNYHPVTKEFTGLIEQADKDSAKSAQVGHFVPMVHANATLLEPPEVEENQIQIYSKTIETHQESYEVIDPDTGETHTEYKTVTEIIENWNIEPDYRKNFVKVDNGLNVYEITTIGEQEGFIIVTREIGEDIKADKDWYKIVDGEIVKKTQEEYEQETLEHAKQAKLCENETIREKFLVSGVEYKNILWDSDIEQKLNLSIQLSSMGDEDVITWVAMDGITSLECTKSDLLAIGNILTKMTAYVWQYKNPMIKTAINNAQTIEELNAIKIVYDLGEINEAATDNNI